ncbi:MAG TPA: hypothetical protein VGI77_07300 [Gaiellaceae bacterium]
MEHISVVRLRLGVALIGIWWIPIWLLGPVVAGLTGQSVGSVTITVAIVQTVIGLFGALLAGRQAAKIVRHTGFRAVPRKIWHVLWTGKMPDAEPADAPSHDQVVHAPGDQGRADHHERNEADQARIPE